jgi:hypothetical protein
MKKFFLLFIGGELLFYSLNGNYFSQPSAESRRFQNISSRSIIMIALVRLFLLPTFLQSSFAEVRNCFSMTAADFYRFDRPGLIREEHSSAPYLHKAKQRIRSTSDGYRSSEDGS